MTSDEVNSVTGKKSVIFTGAGGGGGRRRREIQLNLSGAEILFGQSTRLNLSDLNLSVIFLRKKKKDFGRDMANACTYPAFELIRLELIRLGLYFVARVMLSLSINDFTGHCKVRFAHCC